MKFAQLPLGARFRYLDAVWCKTGPLAASGPDGTQKMIPRSASVEPIDADVAAAPRTRDDALSAHHRACSILLREAARGGPEALEALQGRLDQAHAELVDALL